MLVLVGLVLSIVTIVVEAMAGLNPKESNELDTIKGISLGIMFVGLFVFIFLGI